MPAFLLDAISLLARWAHVVLAIAWLGATGYFAWHARRDPAGGEALFGERDFMWPAYATWLAGFVLLILIYYANAGLWLVDPAVLPLAKWLAIAIGIGVLAGALAVYEGLCRAPFVEKDGIDKGGDAALGVALIVFLGATAWGLAQVFSARGAFLHYGAILGTIMAGNVAHVTVPASRRRQQALRDGREPDARDAWRARQRLLHNASFVPGTVFAMLSSHYPFVFAQRWGWITLVLATAAGLLMYRGTAARLVAAACVVAIAGFAASGRDRGGATVTLEQVVPVIQKHCAPCHTQTPTFPGVSEAPKAVLLDTPARIHAQAGAIRQQAALARAMPPGNATQMSEEERELLGRWSGAR